MDLLITQNGLPPILLKNVGGNKNNWIELAASGDVDSKTAIGTRVELFRARGDRLSRFPVRPDISGRARLKFTRGLARRALPMS